MDLSGHEETTLKDALEVYSSYSLMPLPSNVMVIGLSNFIPISSNFSPIHPLQDSLKDSPL